MQRGVILINAYLKSQSQKRQAERLQEELANVGLTADILRNDAFFACVDGEIRSLLPEKYAFCVYLDKDKYMSQMLENTGLRLFNPHSAIRDCDDKMQTYLCLAGKGVPLMKTLPGLLCYEPTEPIHLQSVQRIEQEIGYPVVVKESFGSLGKNVYLAKDRAELLAVMEQLKCRPHLFQKTALSSMGKDVRVIVVGGKVLGAMLRKSDVDFRSNIELGGTGTPYKLSKSWEELCVRVAEILSLDYCGIDLLFGENGEPMVCEVNSNAFFGGFESVTGVNVAKAYAEYIKKSIS
ncbi:MAG: RimK family alpha-L-glutamate ligase [Clostridia bacterium]|nr:RimK family alpha-L-glutamate ligase [Clostridia bacterium]